MAIVPRPGRQAAVAPIDGTLAKVFPHAYVVASDRGPRVLVHLGIDTVQMDGETFTSLVGERARVHAGEAIVALGPP